MRRRYRSQRSPDISDREWKWLTAAPTHNRFMGLGSNRADLLRLLALWRANETEIRAQWEREGMPAQLPPYHPAEDGGVGLQANACPRNHVHEDGACEA